MRAFMLPASIGCRQKPPSWYRRLTMVSNPFNKGWCPPFTRMSRDVKDQLIATELERRLQKKGILATLRTWSTDAGPCHRGLLALERPMEPTNTIRILVVGDDNVGKSTLVRALCGLTHDAKPPMACRISVRAFEDHIQEFYDIPGSPHFQHGRKLFFSHTRYNAVLFVYDVSDPATRSSVSCVWVPEVMVHLGDAGAVESGGRLDGSDIHVRSRGALNELRFLWRQAFFSHGAVSPIQAGREALRLLMRLFRLILNETGVWTNSSIDREAERMFLATSTVPVAIVGMKADLVNRDDLQRDFLHDHPQAVPHLRLHANNAAHDVKLAAFLKKVADSAKRKPPSSSQRLSSRHSHGHMMIGFS